MMMMIKQMGLQCPRNYSAAWNLVSDSMKFVQIFEGLPREGTSIMRSKMRFSVLWVAVTLELLREDQDRCTVICSLLLPFHLWNNLARPWVAILC